MASKDKEKVIGEELDEAKVARFLEMQPQDGDNADIHVLIKAYRGLPPGAFDWFLDMFKQQGREIKTQDEQGRTILAIAQAHTSQPGYTEVLKKHGATL